MCVLTYPLTQKAALNIDSSRGFACENHSADFLQMNPYSVLRIVPPICSTNSHFALEGLFLLEKGLRVLASSALLEWVQLGVGPQKEYAVARRVRAPCYDMAHEFLEDSEREHGVDDPHCRGSEEIKGVTLNGIVGII